ncbi:MAG: carboxymuconolactone decarboxylase family protein [Dehalococcoidia bacterium]|nr:carboxymuconolactone decarboxylase family protein [Dehalococcoidia bacterium]
MARVRLNETNDLPEDQRWLFERMEQRGPVLNIFRAMSHSPVAMRHFMRLGSYFLEEGKLDAALRELAILRVGHECAAPYEFGQHIALGRRAGLTDAQIRGVGAPNGALFDRRQLSVLAYAGELTAEASASDATHGAVASFLNDEEIVELTMLIGYYNLVSRTLNALEVEPEARPQADLDAIGWPLERG